MHTLSLFLSTHIPYKKPYNKVHSLYLFLFTHNTLSISLNTHSLSISLYTHTLSLFLCTHKLCTLYTHTFSLYFHMHTLSLNVSTHINSPSLFLSTHTHTVVWHSLYLCQYHEAEHTEFMSRVSSPALKLILLTYTPPYGTNCSRRILEIDRAS